MDFDDIVVKESPGLCRCCLSEGCYKDLSTEYQWMDDTEIYADMLLDCFDISISQHAEGPNGANRLICEVCVTRLRDACNFKKQVLASEKKFVDMVGRGAFKPKAVTYNVPIKSEAILEIQPQETEVEFLEAGMDYPDDDVLKDDLGHTSTDDITVSTLPIKGKKGKAKKTMTKAEKKSCSKIVLVEKPKISKPLTKGYTEEEKARENLSEQTDSDFSMSSIPTTKKYTNTEKREIMINNVKLLLLNSTLVPFRWLREFYRCFFCEDIFKTPKEWKSHQRIHDIKKDLNNAINNYFLSVVNVDVTNMECTLCGDNFNEVHKLIDHLIDMHKIDYNTHINCIDSYKFDDVHIYCVLCEKGFLTFSQMFVHTSKEHTQTEYLCDICGRNYSSIYYLQCHIKSKHSNGVKCSQCDLYLPHTKLRTHMQNYHGKKYNCRLCSAALPSTYKLARHMILHGSRACFSCEYCSKTFVFKTTMLRHIRQTHLKEKNAECSICGWKLFGGDDLKKHMLKHSSARNVKCTFCDKTFKTKKTMKQHCINMHEKN
ncbi:PREDICTED: zinc finger protein 596-like isoform X10 [Papilio xuthus]|uniref:Zinc finger protein 596-like isoform X10 n=1 Tax=Papilio xuthus TaxID=66420 RepID=A0AAJ6Z3J8_PAPXU|nr:PREDICTED: zinc finger protein 596-like isoform X10 [Papilio xuthus]